MKKLVQGSIILLLCSLLLLTMSVPVLGKTEETRVWDSIIGKSAEDREQLYASMKLSTNGWVKGKILHHKPFVVVTHYEDEALELKAKLRIWTGVLARVDNDLVTRWDEIWLGTDNQVITSYTDVDNLIVDYYSAPSQLEFQSLEHVGRYPWVSIPTDAEALKAAKELIPNDGLIDTYQVLSKDEADIVTSPAVQEWPTVPAKLHPKRIYPTRTIANVPKDISKHWAEGAALELMAKQVISGYQDGSVKPDQTVVRAEFVAMLLRGLQWGPTPQDKSSYGDVEKHWAKADIGMAERIGLYPARNAAALAFGPNEEITRLEMARILSNTLLLLAREDAGATVNFVDIASLSGDDQASISRVVNNGIMVGDLDGKFHPERKLTRAQAFVVMSRLIYV